MWAAVKLGRAGADTRRRAGQRPSRAGQRGMGHAEQAGRAGKGEGRGSAAELIPGWAEKVGRKIFQIKILFLFLIQTISNTNQIVYKYDSKCTF